MVVFELWRAHSDLSGVRSVICVEINWIDRIFDTCNPVENAHSLFEREVCISYLRSGYMLDIRVVACISCAVVTAAHKASFSFKRNNM